MSGSTSSSISHQRDAAAISLGEHSLRSASGGPTFRIASGKEESIKSLLEAVLGGKSVLRSSHLGNLDRFHLALGGLGFKVLLHEYLTLEKPGYQPGTLWYGGTKLVNSLPSDKDTVATHIGPFDRIPESLLSIVNKVEERCDVEIKSLPQLHYYAARCHGDFVLLSDHLMHLGRPLLELWLGALVEDCPQIFHKYITVEGKPLIQRQDDSDGLFFSDADGTEQVKVAKSDAAGMLIDYLGETADAIKNGRKPCQPGLILDTAAGIVLSTLADDDRNPEEIHERVAYHLSGLRMQDYLLTESTAARVYRKQIQKIYRVIASVSDLELPSFSLKLVPSTHLRMLPSFSQDTTHTMDLVDSWRVADLRSQQLALIKEKYKKRGNDEIIKLVPETVSPKEVAELILKLERNDKIPEGKKRKLSTMPSRFQANPSEVIEKLRAMWTEYGESPSLSLIRAELSNTSNLRQQAATQIKQRSEASPFTQYDALDGEGPFFSREVLSMPVGQLGVSFERSLKRKKG